MNKRQFYLSNLGNGNLVAFKVDDEMFSGKVRQIDSITDEVTVSTTNGSIYTILRKDIVWVKNGSMWPKGIYNALKFKNKGENKYENID